MKKLFTLAFSIIFTMTAFGQRLEYEKSSKWFFGLNVGAAWNTTDVQNKTHAGWGFLLGRSYNYDYGRRISYDLRLRYLHGKWYGQDGDSTNLSHLGDTYNGALAPYKEGLGYTVNNFEANVHELGLELAIHFNRFRDRTGWDPYIFGGANISWNETYGDLLDQDFFLAPDSLTYAYDQIEMNKPAIEFALDDNYETALDGTSANRFNVNFMPSLGFGLGYDFGPRFQMGVEHKTTFALKDDFDGYVDAEPNWGFLQNDVYHYTSAFLRFRFRNGEGRTRPVQPQPTDPTTSNVTNTTPCQFPDVRVSQPIQRTETVMSVNYIYRAEVRFVRSRADITMRINGVETTNFLYNPQTHELESYLYLQPGNNIIEIIGRNACGSDSQTSTIVYNNCIDPVVMFQGVSNQTNTAQVDQRSYSVQAQISNATSVEYTVNGVRTTNFTFNSTTGTFRSNVQLNEGQNTIRITAINACGTDTETSVVTYTNCPDPIVSFVNGSNNFVSVSQANFNLSAYIYNVTSQNNINVRLNGSNRNFSFNASTKQLTANLVLTPGQNKIIISANTSCGTDTETLTIDYTPCVNPSIQLTQPYAQSSTTTNGAQVVTATLNNVSSIGQVQLFVNGNLQQGGSFNAVTKQFQASVPLNAGFNTIQITVVNDCGSDTETISVNYNPCSAPDVQMILPASNGGLTSSPSQLVQAMVFNANNVSEIQTFVNGTLQNGGTYNSANGLYQNTVGLTLGLNTIQVVATNACGSDVQTVTITYRACEAPQITMSSPTTNPFSTSAANINVSAVIGAVSSTSQVQVTVNGVVDASGATYNSSALTYTNNVNLNVGNNVIVITATNSCGTVSKQITVVREVVVINTPSEDIDSITICFVHSNNVGDPVTMMIPLSQWPSYQSQGAQLGPCPVVNEPVDEPMTICYTINGTPTTMQILTSEWPAYQALGATQGACPEPTMTICFRRNELTIPVSQWSSYQSQGATEGPCPVQNEETIIICHKPPGNPTNTQQLEIPLSAWPAHQAHGDVLGPCPTEDPEMVICLNGTEQTILTSEWASYQAQGATQGPCPVVADPSMPICLNGTPMTILTSEWPTYQAQGATQGPCPAEEMITICHKPPGNPTNTQELQIPLSAWPAHQAHGDVLGPCPTTGNGNNGNGNGNSGNNGNNGNNGNEMITICHHPPGNPTNTQELQIPMSAWPAHQAHGDVMGPCSTEDPEMVICLNGEEQTILTSQWTTYQAQGATEGPCPTTGNGNNGNGNGNSGNNGNNGNNGNEMITICHHPPGNPTNTQELQIPLSAWPAHQAHGDVLGPCPTTGNGNNGNGNGNSGNGNNGNSGNNGSNGNNNSTLDPEIAICLNGSEMTILTSEWATYQAQGATLGPCPVEVEKMTICYNNKTMEIDAKDWSRYRTLGAKRGACDNSPVDGNVNVGNGSVINSDTLGGTINRPTDGGDDDDELLFGNRTITICHTPEGSIASQTMQIPLSEWQEYQALGATLGACAGSLSPSNGGSNVNNVNTNGTGNSDGVGNVPINPNNTNSGSGTGTEPSGGNMPVVGNGSQQAKDELIRKQEEERLKAEQEEAARKAEEARKQAEREAAAKKEAELKAAQEEAKRKAAEKAKQEQQAKEAEARRKAEEAKKQAEKDAQLKAAQEEAKRKAAQDAENQRKAAEEKARQEQAAKDAAARKAAQEAEARRQAEEAKKKAAAEKAAREAEAQRKAAEEKARQEKAAREAEARRKAEAEKAAREAEEARRKAAQEAAAKREAEEARRKAEAEKAAREAEARRKAEEARKKAEAEKAAREKAAREAEAKRKAEEEARKKAAAEKAERDAAAKKAAEEAAKKKAEEERKTKEREGGR